MTDIQSLGDLPSNTLRLQNIVSLEPEHTQPPCIYPM